jgi:hypothetical protein
MTGRDPSKSERGNQLPRQTPRLLGETVTRRYLVVDTTGVDAQKLDALRNRLVDDGALIAKVPDHWARLLARFTGEVGPRQGELITRDDLTSFFDPNMGKIARQKAARIWNLFDGEYKRLMGTVVAGRLPQSDDPYVTVQRDLVSRLFVRVSGQAELAIDLLVLQSLVTPLEGWSHRIATDFGKMGGGMLQDTQNFVAQRLEQLGIDTPPTT